jgi:hypothetical protein
MSRLVDGDVAAKAITLGAVVSTTTPAGDPNTADTFPIASFAHGYRVYVPSDATVYVAGAEPVQPGLPAAGGVADSVIRYPVTPMLSVAVKEVIGISRLFDGDVAVKAVTVGAVASTSTVAGVAYTADTFPAASFAHGYSVYVPSEATVYVAGAEPVQPGLPAAGGVADSVIRYPVTPTVSVAVNDVIGISRLAEGDVAEKAVTVGAAVSTSTVRGVANTADTFPTASLAHGYNVYVPSVATVYVAGAEPVHPGLPAAGGDADSVIK